MKNLTIHDLMSELSSERPIFHNEADLQHALAWRIHTLDPDGRVRLEARFGDIFVDLWLPDSRTAFELKFARDHLEINHDGEYYDLRKGAWDATAHSFVRDIERLERLSGDGVIEAGFAVLLSNDPAMWTPPKPRSAPAIFDAFRLHDDQPPLAGLRSVTDAASARIAKDYPPVLLAGSYPLAWRPYAVHKGRGRGKFRYLAVEV